MPKRPTAPIDTAQDPLAVLETQRLVKLQARLAGSQESGATQEPSPLGGAREAAAQGIWSDGRPGIRSRPPYSLT